MKKRIILLFLLLLGINFNSYSKVIEKKESKAGVMLRLNPYARSAALGDGGVSLPKLGPYSIWLNPAALPYGLIEDKEAAFSYSSWLQGTNHYSLFYSQNLDILPKSYVGVGWQSCSIEGIEKREESSRLLGEYSSKEEVYTLNLSSRINDIFSVGTNIKYLYMRIDEKKYTSWAIDLGSFLIEGDKFALGIALQNLGPKIKGSSLPLNFRLGTTYFLSPQLKLLAELNKEIKEDLSLIIGGEWEKGISSFQCGISFQGGKKTEFYCGGGIKTLPCHINYSFTKNKDLESDIHLFSLHLILPTLLRKPPPEEFICPICKERFKDFATFQKHKELHPPPPSPGIPFKLYDINVEYLSPTEVKISWLSNVPASSAVYFGTTEKLGNKQEDENLVLYHTIVLRDLIPAKEYYFCIVSKDVKNKVVVTEKRKFCTPLEIEEIGF